MFVSMAYGDLIKELFERSQMSVKDYAEAVQLSPQHLSNILGKHEPGSFKVLQNCLRHAKIELEECMELPDERKGRAEHLILAEKLLRRKDRFGLALRDFIEDQERRVRLIQPSNHAPPPKRRGAS